VPEIQKSSLPVPLVLMPDTLRHAALRLLPVSGQNGVQLQRCRSSPKLISLDLKTAPSAAQNRVIRGV